MPMHSLRLPSRASMQTFAVGAAVGWVAGRKLTVGFDVGSLVIPEGCRWEGTEVGCRLYRSLVGALVGIPAVGTTADISVGAEVGELVGYWVGSDVDPVGAKVGGGMVGSAVGVEVTGDELGLALTTVGPRVVGLLVIGAALGFPCSTVGPGVLVVVGALVVGVKAVGVIVGSAALGVEVTGDELGLALTTVGLRVVVLRVGAKVGDSVDSVSLQLQFTRKSNHPKWLPSPASALYSSTKAVTLGSATVLPAWSTLCTTSRAMPSSV